MSSRARLTLDLPEDLEGLTGERVANRMKALGKLIGREPQVRLVALREAAE